MELNEFYEKIPDNDNLPTSGLIPYFMYYLLLNKDVVSASEIKKLL